MAKKKNNAIQTVESITTDIHALVLERGLGLAANEQHFGGLNGVVLR